MGVANIVVTGCLRFNGYEVFSRMLEGQLKELARRERITPNGFRILIGNGDRDGWVVEWMTEAFAKTMRLPLKTFYTDWKKYGRSALFQRNLRMVQAVKGPGNYIIVISDVALSRPVATMIELASGNGTQIIRLDASGGRDWDNIEVIYDAQIR